MPPRVRALIGSLLLAALACRPPGAAPRLDPEGLSLLRLEYLERAARLPALRFDEVALPDVEHLGAFSPLRWERRAPDLPGDEALRDLPYGDAGPRLREALAQSLHEFGFHTQPLPGRPALRLRVDVAALVLRSEAAPVDRRRCDLECELRLIETGSGLELGRYRVRGRSELPGSWLTLREGHVQWAPQPDEPDPLAAAAAAAAEDFLRQSLPFWSDPANWEEGGVNLTALGPGAAPAPPAGR